MTEPQPPGQKIGKNMLILSWILALAGLTLFFSQQEKNQLNPNQTLVGSQTENTVQVKLIRNRYGHYVATGSINGRPVTFILDTGATDVSVPAHLQNTLGLKRGPQFTVSTANGNISVWATRLDSLALGPIKLQNVRASINPGMNDDEILLGMSALKTLDFSQNDDVLTLTQYLN